MDTDSPSSFKILPIEIEYEQMGEVTHISFSLEIQLISTTASTAVFAQSLECNSAMRVCFVNLIACKGVVGEIYVCREKWYLLIPDPNKQIYDNRDKSHLIEAYVNSHQASGSCNDAVRTPIPRDAQIFVWRRDNGRCVNCGSNQKLEFDHIIPLSQGGSSTARNLQLLCESCNRSKANRIGGEPDILESSPLA